MNNLSKITAGSLAAVLAFSMAACGSSSASSDGAGESAGKAVTVNGKSAKATSLADFGTMEDLEKAAKEEGALNVIAARLVQLRRGHRGLQEEVPGDQGHRAQPERFLQGRA